MTPILLLCLLCLAAGASLGWISGYRLGEQGAWREASELYARSGAGWPPPAQPVAPHPEPPRHDSLERAS